MSFVTRLQQAQTATKSWLCVGLDFDATIPYCCGWKPNVAFYESHGSEGWRALEHVARYIKTKYPEHLLIIDAKRGDIGNTARHYAQAVKGLGADAVTVNPYLGPETLRPYFDAQLGVIALCVTSNPDAAKFQNLETNGLPLYWNIATTLTQMYGETGNLGLVTGATHPEKLAEVRELIRELSNVEVVLLIPGIGKQGGDLEATLKANADGPCVINSSSGIIFASQDEDFAEAAANKAEETNNAINRLRVTESAS